MSPGCSTTAGEGAQANFANVKLSINTNSKLLIWVGIQLSRLSSVTLICHVPLNEGRVVGIAVLSCEGMGNRDSAHQSGGDPLIKSALPPIDTRGVRGQQKKVAMAPSTKIKKMKNTDILEVVLLRKQQHRRRPFLLLLFLLLLVIDFVSLFGIALLCI